MTNKDCKIKLVREYGEICFLNGIISTKNILTFHHIVPIREKQITNTCNGALLTRVRHDMFNEIERHCYKKGKEINDYLRYFKETRDELARIQMGLYVEKEIENIGYEIEDTGKMYVLRKKR